MTKPYSEKLKEKISAEVYERLEDMADAEVGLALKMPLLDKYGTTKNYYQQRQLMDKLIDECILFENLGIKFSPLDIVNVLFRCKMSFAVDKEEEYSQRVGGGSYVDEFRFIIRWEEKSKGIEELVSQYLKRMVDFIDEKIVITEISNFYSNESTQDFFNKLFKKLDLPFILFIDNLVDEHKKFEPGLRKYNKKEAKEFFNAPSLGFRAKGTETYVIWFATAWLRELLNFLRIGFFIFPPQVDFGQSVEVIAPKNPVFLGRHAFGCYNWEQDEKEPWEKIPDGCLFLSFGYRGLSNMWLDGRSFDKFENLIIKNKIFLDSLNNPWLPANLDNIAPVMDILSTATQVQDLGAKILLIYCCLENMFVPDSITRDNKKYIIGGINALKPDLLDWFYELYKLRCKYAHEGFIAEGKTETRIFVQQSVENCLQLLHTKIEKI